MVDDWATDKAKALIPCTVPPGSATCPFGWNNCRRQARCELIDDVAEALRELTQDRDRLRAELTKVKADYDDDMGRGPLF